MEVTQIEQMDRKQTLEIVKKCQPTIAQVYNLQSKIIGCDSQEQKLREEIKSKTVSLFTIFLGAAIIGLLLTVVLVGTLGDIFNVDIWTLFFIILVILFGAVFYFLYVLSKRELNNEKEFLNRDIDSLKMETMKVKEQLTDLLNSEDGQYAIANIPKDYFYPNAVEKFIFFLSNGHADSMKEALKEYDLYVHNCKIEYEMARAADASERAARASEKAAASSAAVAKKLSSIQDSVNTIEQHTSNLSFWTNYAVFRGYFN